MATEKGYTVKVANGRMTITLKDKDAKGRVVSISGDCPMKVQGEARRWGRKQVEKYLLGRLGFNA